jgi:hypothetical protein
MVSLSFCVPGLHCPWLTMTETVSTSRFKAEMPDIPGVGGPTPPPRRSNPLLPLIAGIGILVVILVLGLRWLSHSKPSESVPVEPAAQIDVPAAPPDPNAALPHANEANPVIATVTELAKPWSHTDFFIRNKLSGENVPATIVRLPGGSAGDASGYWAFTRQAPYGECKLEFISDLEKLRTDYEYRHASHPLVANPCSHTLYDPLKFASLAGNVLVRGAIVQGGDIRPPLGVEIKVRNKEILAIRTE